MSLLPSLKLDDIPVEKVTPLSGMAILGRIQQKEISGGYVQVSLPLYYVPSSDTTNGVAPMDYETLTALAENVTDNESAKEAGLKTFLARWNVKPDWFSPGFLQALRAGQIDQVERTMYQINVVGITRGLFKALGVTHIDFDSVEPGSIIAFKAASSKKEPDRLQIRLFYPPKRG